MSRTVETTPNEHISMKIFRTALSKRFGRSKSRKHKQLDAEPVIACDEAEENLIDEQEDEEIEQEEKSRDSWIKRHHCCTTTSTRLQELHKRIVQSLRDLVFFMRYVICTLLCFF